MTPSCPVDPTKYYPGYGVDDMNINYYYQKSLLEDFDPDGIEE